MRTVKITEEQYKTAIDEGVTITADTKAFNGDVGQAAAAAKNDAEKSGVNLKDVKIEVPCATEAKVASKDNLSEDTLKKLIKNSELYSVSDFLKK